MRTNLPSPGGRNAAGRLRGSFLLAMALTLAPAAARGATYSLPGFSDTAVVQSLSSPTDFTWTPDGRMLVLEQAGQVRIVVGGVLQTTPALSLSVDSGGEKGLLGICLDPNFVSNGYVYLYYTTATPKNRISRFTMTGDTLSPASELVILDNIDATSGTNNGGTVAIGPDGKLWAAPGDAGTSVQAQALSPGSVNGKVLRMELDGLPAAGNPFFGDVTKEQRIFAYGFRNPFRFSFRPSNNALFVADVGNLTWEELDAIPIAAGGGNYGWPMAEGPLETSPCPGCVPPVFSYDHGLGRAVIGGVFVTGSAYPGLQGKYVFGDYVDSWIKFLEFDSGNAVVGIQQDMATGAEGPVAFHNGPDGLLYYAAISSGRIYRINPPASSFHTVTPCRIVDTRNPAGPYGGPALTAGGTRDFRLAGQCGVPPGARAVAVNVTVTLPTAVGDLRIYPAGGALPASSVINFRAGQTRANNAVLTLSPTGDISVRFDAASGGVHFLLDVNGYFE